MQAAGNFGSPTQLIIIAVIILLLFGGKRLRSLGSDFGQAIKGFKNSMSNDKDKENEPKTEDENSVPKNLSQQPTPQPVKQAEKNEHKE